MIKLVLRDPAAKEKVTESLFESFPQIRDAAFRIYTDDDGEQHFVDMDGVEREPQDFLR